MSEDNQWRQLGSIVNAVLMDAKTKAVRRGGFSEIAPQIVRQNPVQIEAQPLTSGLGHGFLSASPMPAPRPIQLELPFGIGDASEQSFASVRSTRGMRLM